VPIPLSHAAGIMLRGLGVPVAPFWAPTEESILWQLRLPRVLAAALVGASLAASGTLLQGLFRNPLVDPFVLGLSAGAGLAATVTLALLAAGFGIAPAAALRWTGFGPVPLAASLGGLAAVLIVYNLARSGGRVPTTRLLLAGLALSSVLGAASTMLVLLSDRLLLNWRIILAWLFGGVAVSGWGQVRAVLPLAIAGLLAAWALARWLDALLLGEEGAAQVGVPVEGAKVAIVLVASVLTGASVALAGLVSFVGLLVPHAVRLVLGPAHRTLVPAAALAGAVFLVLADLLARTVAAPTELPVGVITALVGGPAFLWLLHREAGYAPGREDR
jgi:iron complex transport system permease protein